jgi:hypothetical protein
MILAAVSRGCSNLPKHFAYVPEERHKENEKDEA